MDERSRDRDLIDRLLLGRAGEEEQQQAEERVFADDAFFAELEDREDELADDYAHGRLAGADRADFEHRQRATPTGRERMAFARAAARVARRSPVVQPWAPAWLPMAAAVAFAVVAAALGVRSHRLGQELRDDRARSAAREQALERRLEEERAALARPTALPAPLLVLPEQGARDGGDMPALALPAGAASVGLAVPLLDGPTFASYQAVLRTVEGALVWEDAGLMPHGGRIVLEVPVRALPPGDYILTLNGRRRTGRPAEILDRYFRIPR